MMKRMIYKRVLTGLLCVSLLSADFMSAEIAVFAAETETNPITETEFSQEEEAAAVEENHTDTAESQTQNTSEEAPVVEVQTPKTEFAEDKQETGTEELKTSEEGESEKYVTKDAVTEKAAEDETVIKEAETIDENNTESAVETKEPINSDLSATDDIASGIINETYGHMTWVIDKNGKLTVEGTGDYADPAKGNHYSPWYSYRDYIKTAEIKVSGMTNTRGMFSNHSALTNINLSHCDTRSVTNMAAMFNGCTSLTTLDLSSFDTRKVTTMRGMFGNCSNLIRLDLSSFDTRNVTDMEYMFGECYKLGTVNLGSFDTAKVTDMSQMFQNCSITSLNLNHFNTRSVTNMYAMFLGCGKLTSLNLSSFDTNNVTTMKGMFDGCFALTNLNLSSFDTRKVTDMSFMFYNCPSLSNLDLSSFNTANVTNMGSMFCSLMGNGHSLSNLNISSFDTAKVTDMSMMFYGCDSLSSLDLSGFITGNVTDMHGMFGSCDELTHIEFNNFDTSKVTNMSDMFFGCSALTELNLSNFETGQVTDMQQIFCACRKLTSLNVSNFNTSKVTNMQRMFGGCAELTGINLSSFDTSNVTDMSSMFNGCFALTNLNLSNFDTHNVTTMAGMFINCDSLTNLDLSNFDTHNVTTMASMFCCDRLVTLNLSSFDTSNVTDMSYMFAHTRNLTSLNLSNFDTSNVTDIRDIFLYCDNLDKIYAPRNLNQSAALPINYGEIWHCLDGTAVTELPQNVNYSIEVRKLHTSEEPSPDSQLNYVQNLTRVSLQNADSESRSAIQNALYNLLFRAQYRPIRSDIPGDAMTFTGSRDVIAQWPVQNKDYQTPVFWNRTVTDSQLGTITYNIASAGCMSYACFASTYIYGTSGCARLGANFNTDTMKAFIRQHADPGEQLRYNMPHSIVFLGESSDGSGFYYLSYDGGDDGEGHIYHDLSASYTSYERFAAVVGSYKGASLYIYDTNNGSYYSKTAASAAAVRSGNGAQKIVARLACPIEAAITLDGETLDSRNPETAGFGSVARDGEDIVFTLDYSLKYELSVIGTGEGAMTLTLEYYDNNNKLIDQRKFVNIPINTSTEIQSGGFDAQASFVLYTSDNTSEITAWSAGIGEAVEKPDNMNRGDNLSAPDKVCLISFNANGGSASAAIMTTEPDGTLSNLPTAERDGYHFKGWYTSAIHGVKVEENRTYAEDTTLYAQWEKKDTSEGDTPGDDTPKDDIYGNVLPEDIPTDHKIPEGFWIAGIAESGYSYTGDAVIPETRVYDKTTLLAEKTDYTITFKNNKNVGEATITVTGKGSYSGKETAAFHILPADLSGDDFSMEAFYVKTSQKTQSPIPELYYMGTKLKHKKDFTIKYTNTSGVYTQAGEYSATITGTGNYTGTRDIRLTAVTKIAKKPSMSIAKASLTGFEKAFPYTGKPHRQECKLSVQMPEGERMLTEGTDYTVRYTNNTKAGTATVTYSGKNGYTGKLKKTFKILPYDISQDSEKKLAYDKELQCAYAKDGSKPKPVITFNGRKMTEGADYTLSYKNNKAVSGKKAPSVIVNGKGSFKGKLELFFTINPQELSKMTLVSCDKVYQKKAGIYRITPKLMDLDGKLLSAGKDFDKHHVTYTYETAVTLENGIAKQAGAPVEDSDIIPADTQIRVTFGSGTSGYYTGTFTDTYRIVKADIKSAKVAIPNQSYTGKEVTLDKSDITVTLSGTTLKPEDYDILQYTDNVQKGKASVTIKGKGNYGGTKTIKFTIGTKGFLWWWRKK